MNTDAIKVGKKHAIKIGRNEVEVLVTEKTERGWKVQTSGGKTLAINNAERFIRCLEEPEELSQNSQDLKPQASSLKPKLSMLNAAVEILKGVSHSMSAKELVVAMEDAGLWKSPGGKTPWNTVSAAIGKEIREKENPRFQKTGKGLFSLVEGV
jgi:hypothetical protein